MLFICRLGLPSCLFWDLRSDQLSLKPMKIWIKSVLHSLSHHHSLQYNQPIRTAVSWIIRALFPCILCHQILVINAVLQWVQPPWSRCQPCTFCTRTKLCLRPQTKYRSDKSSWFDKFNLCSAFCLRVMLNHWSFAMLRLICLLVTLNSNEWLFAIAYWPCETVTSSSSWMGNWADHQRNA